MITGKPDNANGFTKIANELLEVMALYPFTKSEYKALLAIIRQTYGWKRKKNKLSYGIIARLTGMSRRQAKRTIDKLVKDNVLFRESDRTGSIFGINKYYLLWKLWITQESITQNVHTTVPKMSTPTDKNVHTSMDAGVHTLPSGERKERNIYKESIKERGHFYPQPFFKNKKDNYRGQLKEPISIGKVITAIT